MHALIIDDDLFLKKALSFNLLEMGHTVATAGDGREALNQIEKDRNFDIIFCDVMMPVLTGPGFLLQLKKYYPEKLPVVVVISAVKDGEDFLHKIEVNYDHFIKKPIDMPQLRRLIEEISASKVN